MRAVSLMVSLLACATLVAIATSCNSTPESAGQSGSSTPLGEEDLTAYAIGYSLGERVRTGLESDGIAADHDAILQGFRDALDTLDPAFDADALQEELFRIQEELDARMVEEQLANNEEFRRLVEDKLAASSAFMATNGARPGVETGERGGQWEVLKDSDGPVPTERDTVEINFVGTLADGTVFQRDEGHIVQIDTTIPGARQILTRMPVGSTWRVFVPPELGYGVAGLPPAVGPNEVLIIDVELLRIVN